MTRLLTTICAIMALLITVKAGSIPLALPRVEMPNVTAIMASVQEGLKTAATTVLAEKVKVRPFKCPNGKPLVTCLFDVCPKGACPGKVCIPDYCGKCSNKCVELSLPSLDTKMPSLPTFSFKMPNLTALANAKACGLNEAINVTAVASSIVTKDSKAACKTCPDGTVAKPPALACTICPPGTFADRSQGACKKCAAGTYSSTFGAAACKPCEVNSFTPVSGLFGCIKCPIGFAAAAAGSTKCEYKGFSS